MPQVQAPLFYESDPTALLARVSPAHRPVLHKTADMQLFSKIQRKSQANTAGQNTSSLTVTHKTTYNTTGQRTYLSEARRWGPAVPRAQLRREWGVCTRVGGGGVREGMSFPSRCEPAKHGRSGMVPSRLGGKVGAEGMCRAQPEHGEVLRFQPQLQFHFISQAVWNLTQMLLTQSSNKF